MKIIKYGVLILLLFFPFKAYGYVNQEQLDLTINPQKVLFDISNLKPGDSIERVLVVGNTGKEVLKYTATSKFIEGSPQFYNKLYLKISDEKEILFNGDLSEFKELAPRVLDKQKSEELVFIVKVPADLGNEFQGQYSKVQFKFFVEGTLGGILPANGPKLPETGTAIFNFLISGVVLVIFGMLFQIFIWIKTKVENKNV